MKMKCEMDSVQRIKINCMYH